MARRVSYSFHYTPDNWRASQVRNIGAIEGNRSASDNDWETVKRGGDPAIKRWIDDQLSGRSCTIVLIGQDTAGRKWINYEIEKSWNEGKGVFGIHIHRLKDRFGQQNYKGDNPFYKIPMQNGGWLGSYVNAYDPPYHDSGDVYGYIAGNLAAWIDKAVTDRR